MKNIVNIDSVESLIKHFLSEGNKAVPNLENYINRNIRNYLLRKAPAKRNYLFYLKTFLLKKTEIEKRILKNGGPFYSVIISQDLYREVNHVVGFLRDNPSLIKDSLEYTSALVQSEAWTKSLQKTKNSEKEQTETVMEFSNGFKMVKLINRSSYIEEGKRMNHCVASYSSLSSEEVFSLRDQDGDSKVTLSVTKGTNSINEYVGKDNEDVEDKFKFMLNEFAKEKNLKFVVLKKYFNVFDLTSLVFFLYITFHWENMLEGTSLAFLNTNPCKSFIATSLALTCVLKMAIFMFDPYSRHPTKKDSI